MDRNVAIFVLLFSVTIIANFYFNYITDVPAESHHLKPHKPFNLVESITLAKELGELDEKMRQYQIYAQNITPHGFQPQNDAFAPVPMLKYLAGNLKTVMRHRLAVCVVAKNMSTIIAAIMCFLDNPTAFLAANRTITGETFSTRFCYNKNEYVSVELLLNKTHTARADWLLYAIVRDPLERLISAFMDKCVQNPEKRPPESLCHNCTQDIECFIETVYKRAISYAHGLIPFNEIVMEDWHTFPQHWMCGLSNATGTGLTVVKYSSDTKLRKQTYKELIDIFKTAHIEPPLIADVLDQLHGGTTFHATVTSPEKAKYRNIVTENKELMRTIYRLYFHDYKLFDFPFPYQIN